MSTEAWSMDMSRHTRYSRTNDDHGCPGVIIISNGDFRPWFCPGHDDDDDDEQQMIFWKMGLECGRSMLFPRIQNRHKKLRVIPRSKRQDDETGGRHNLLQLYSEHEKGYKLYTLRGGGTTVSKGGHLGERHACPSLGESVEYKEVVAKAGSPHVYRRGRCGAKDRWYEIPPSPLFRTAARHQRVSEVQWFVSS